MLRRPGIFRNFNEIKIFVILSVDFVYIYGLKGEPKCFYNWTALRRWNGQIKVLSNQNNLKGFTS